MSHFSPSLKSSTPVAGRFSTGGPGARDYNRAVRLLITRLSALGDIVHTWPLAVALRRSPAVTALAWVVEQALVPLVSGHPAVDEVVPVATRRWRRRPLAGATRDAVRDAAARLRAFAPDVALDPQGLLKSAVWGRLSGAPRRVGFDGSHRRERLAGAFYTERARVPHGLVHVVDLNLSLAAALGGDPPYGAAPDGCHLLGGSGPLPDPGTVTLLPSTGGSGKRWPPDAFARLAQRLGTAGHRVSVAWGPGEEALAREVARAGGAAATVAPPTTLLELAGYLAASAVVVGGDTGPVHLAAALGTPTVAVFVATDPERNGPRGARVTILSAARAGARRGRARTAVAGEVPVEAVAGAVRDRLEGRPG